LRVVVIVNQVKELGYRQTTSMLAASLVRAGCDVFLADVDGLTFSNSNSSRNFVLSGCQLTADSDFDSNSVETFAKSDFSREEIQLSAGDVIWIRTNPGRDLARLPVHDSFLEICYAAAGAGIRVINRPDHLRYFASKAALASLDPRYCPAMMISHCPEAILNFIHAAESDCVVKPLIGSRGQDVIRVSKSDSDLKNVIESTFGNRGLVAQHFVDADQPGDKRVIALDGKILEINGSIAGIERRPAADDFRANLHAGGRAEPLVLNEQEKNVVRYAAKKLIEKGIWLAGVDLIGTKIIEFNVFSTGGLFDGSRFSGIDFADAIVERFLNQFGAGSE